MSFFNIRFLIISFLIFKLYLINISHGWSTTLLGNIMIKQFLPPNVNSYMEYISLSWYDISESVVRHFVDRRLLLFMKLLNQICLVVINDPQYVPFVAVTSRCFHLSRLNKSNTTCTTIGAGAAFPSSAPQLTTVL